MCCFLNFAFLLEWLLLSLRKEEFNHLRDDWFKFRELVDNMFVNCWIEVIGPLQDIDMYNFYEKKRKENKNMDLKWFIICSNLNYLPSNVSVALAFNPMDLKVLCGCSKLLRVLISVHVKVCIMTTMPLEILCYQKLKGFVSYVDVVWLFFVCFCF